MICLETRCTFSRAWRNHLKGVHSRTPGSFQAFFLQLPTNSFPSKFRCHALPSLLAYWWLWPCSKTCILHLIRNVSAEVPNAMEKLLRGLGQQQGMQGDPVQLCSQLEWLPGSFHTSPVAAPGLSCRSLGDGRSWETAVGHFITPRAFQHKWCSFGTTALKSSLANRRRLKFSWSWGKGRMGWQGVGADPLKSRHSRLADILNLLTS